MRIELPRTKAEKAAIILWGCILVIITVGSLIPKVSPPGQAFGLDKILHAFAFLLLAALPLYGIPDRKAAILIALLVAPYGYLLEFLQGSVPGREFSPHDLIANNLGALIGLLIGGIVRLKVRYFSKSGEKP
ncbi:MAG: VanZ family protein [Thermodesulfobacteriota bacterium]